MAAAELGHCERGVEMRNLLGPPIEDYIPAVAESRAASHAPYRGQPSLVLLLAHGQSGKD